MAGRVAVLYHYPCPDGAFAALAAHLYHTLVGVPAVFFPNSVYSPLKVQDLGRNSFDTCYLLDFVGPEGFALELCSAVKKVIVLDHHKTGFDALSSAQCSVENLMITYDVKKSAAKIAFEYFTDKLQSDLTLTVEMNGHSQESERKTLVEQSSLSRIRELFDYIEDADIWAWKLPHSKAFSCGLRCLNIDYDANANPDLFLQLLSLNASEVITAGQKELPLIQTRLDAAVGNSFVINLGQGLYGKCLAVENVDELADVRSELGHQLAAKSLAVGGLRPIGAVVYRVHGTDSSLVKVSLRSIEGEDTTVISQAYGGGGHAEASSFMIRKISFEGWKVRPKSQEAVQH